MPYLEERTDEEFLAVLSTEEAKSTTEVAEALRCSHNGAKGRLMELAGEDGKGIILKTKKDSAGRDGFTYMWTKNKNYKAPEIKVEYEGLYFWDRGVRYDRANFVKLAELCKQIVGVSKVQLTESIFSEDIITLSCGDEDKFAITRGIYNTALCIRGDDKGRYYEYYVAMDKECDLVIVACLLALKQIFPKTKLSLGTDKKTIDEAVTLIKSLTKNFDDNKLMKKLTTEANRTALIEKFTNTQGESKEDDFDD